MAQAATIRFGKTAILLGDGATPTEVFAAPCGFTELSMQVAIATGTTNVPDCADPDLASWLETDLVSQQMILTGSGVLDRAAMQIWQTWWFDDGNVEKNVRWFRDLLLADGGGHFQGPGIITDYRETGRRGERWTVDVTITLNGKPTWTDAAA